MHDKIPTVKNGQELIKAFEEVGFAIIDPLDWCQDFNYYTLAATYAIAEEFFSMDVDYKMQFHVPGENGQIGYVPFGIEKAKDQDVPDLKEFLHIPNRMKTGPLWIKVHPREFNLISAFQETFAELETLGLNILSSIQAELKIDSLLQVIENKEEGISLLRVLHYPPTGDSLIGIRSAPHEDINLITILPCRSAAGLQVRAIDGMWLDAPTDKNLILVNVGDQLQELTGGRLRSTTHRVINTEEGKTQSRFSLPFFLHPAKDFRLSDRYTSGEYLEERLKEIGLK